jgi:hypothetical protein
MPSQGCFVLWTVPCIDMFVILSCTAVMQWSASYACEHTLETIPGVQVGYCLYCFKVRPYLSTLFSQRSKSSDFFVCRQQIVPQHPSA